MRAKKLGVLITLLLAGVAPPTAFTDTFTVISTNDSGVGSLRQAIVDANALAGADTIHFNIPGNSVHTISPISPLPHVSDSVTIDGYSQPGAAENTDATGFSGRLLIELNGSDAGSNVDGLTISIANCTVRGLVINRFNGYGIRLESASNVIEGNFIGTDASGTARLGNMSAGVYLLDAPFNIIGGSTAAARNVISANMLAGIILDQPLTGGTLVQGNFIGTDATATTGLGNAEDGIVIQDAGTVTIGGSSSQAGNVISGNGGDGIFISGAGSEITFVGYNLIGTKSNGTDPLGNANNGIDLSSSDPPSNIFIPEGNVVAFNDGSGVYVGGGTGHRIFANSIFSNGGLGIDLGGPGITANDEGDADDGPNGLQNFPVLTRAVRSGGKTTVSGTLNSTPDNSFMLHFYANSAADPSGNGEGQTYLGGTDITTDSTGNAPFAAEVSGLAPTGQNLITATATNETYESTSEFSAPVELINHASRFLNVSTRLNVQTEDAVLIAGFIITGSETEAKKVIVRALGPSLGSVGLVGALGDPVLELHQPDGIVVINDNWRNSQEQEIIATTIPPENDFESAIVATLKPGAYTAVMRGTNGTTGIGLIEAYDLDQPIPSLVADISTRGMVRTGDHVMIAGFISGGDASGSSSILIRALGPSLSDAGVANPLQDPTVEVWGENGNFIIANDDWKLVQKQSITETGVPPTDDREAAIITTFPPGAYSVIVRGKNETTGVGLVEIYNLQ